MADFDSDYDDSNIKLEIATAYIQLCIEHVQKYYMKHPMCTSILSGKSYVKEVLEGNPQVCYDIFRMDKHIFKHLCNELRRLHLLEEDTGIVLAEESVGTLLFIVGHNTDFRLLPTACNILLRPFEGGFSVHCRLSMHWDVSSFGLTMMQLSFLIHFAEITNIIHGLRYDIILKCVGAIDGTHINASAPSSRTTAFRDRRSDITQNVMSACNFDIRFTYVHAGWEESANDSRFMQDAIGHAEYEFPCPPTGSYYLVDLGYTIGIAFLLPTQEGLDVRNSDASIVGDARVGSEGNEEAFNPCAQRAMAEYCDAITAAMWTDYTANCD
ncbi:hypothetical protein SO802_009662 [Lithocarpus litseifolius]|uniref:DDE Tnp4 domain-containing protein n=1 Tax=Lithocarpus litseifolius TaxID=425828 RepID=A0AAW2DC24_9ROSI